LFVDVILPVPLNGTFTYSVPKQWEGQVQRGLRVVVPFGRNKTYVGIISQIHDQASGEYQTKDILQMLDDSPILLDSQLKLW
jgi:primosomal protein N' (replication factor Y)